MTLPDLNLLDSKLDDEQEMIRDTARKFTEDSLVPGSQERDEAGAFDRANVDALAELGFPGLTVSEDGGGAGMTAAAGVLAYEELSTAGASVAASLAVHLELGSRLLDLAIEKGANTVFASTREALATGSQLATFAGDRGEFRVVDGKVTGRGAPVPNATAAGVAILRTVSDEGNALWLVDLSTAGVRVEDVTAPLGLRTAGVGRVVCEDFAPDAGTCILEGAAADEVFATALANVRLAMAAILLGLGVSARDRALRYSQERMAFGKSLAKQQAVALKLGRMSEGLTSARYLVSSAGRAAGETGIESAAAFAKSVAADAAVHCADESIQIHGGYGFVTEYDVERLYRDAKMCAILFGDSEACRIEVADRMLASS